MSEQPHLSDTYDEAYDEYFIMRVFYKRGSQSTKEQFDRASGFVSRIKSMHATLSDDELIEFHEHSIKQYEDENTPEKVFEAADLYEDAITALPFLDVDRAFRIYNNILEKDGLHEGTRSVVNFAMPHLTRFAGDRAMSLWRDVLSLSNHDLNEDAIITAGMVLEHPEIYPLSEAGKIELQLLIDEASSLS